MRLYGYNNIESVVEGGGGKEASEDQVTHWLDINKSWE